MSSASATSRVPRHRGSLPPHRPGPAHPPGWVMRPGPASRPMRALRARCKRAWANRPGPASPRPSIWESRFPSANRRGPASPRHLIAESMSGWDKRRGPASLRPLIAGSTWASGNRHGQGSRPHLRLPFVSGWGKGRGTGWPLAYRWATRCPCSLVWGKRRGPVSRSRSSYPVRSWWVSGNRHGRGSRPAWRFPWWSPPKQGKAHGRGSRCPRSAAGSGRGWVMLSGPALRRPSRAGRDTGAGSFPIGCGCKGRWDTRALLAAEHYIRAPMTTFRNFDEVALMQKHRSEQFIDQLVTETLVLVRSRTPIKTGNARSGWDRFPPGLSETGTTQWIFNSVPYIVKLEFGYSRQAPQGMARITAAEMNFRAPDIVSRVVINI